MKKLFIALVAVVTLASCNQSKMGYVDISKLMKEYDAVKDLEKEMKKKSEEMDAKFAPIVAELEAKQKAGKLSQAEYQQFQMAYQQEGGQLQNESQERSDKIIDDVKEFIKEYAKKNSYSFVFGSNESGNVLYGDEKTDLTETMIDALNKDYEEGGKTDEKASEEGKDSAKTEKK